MLPPNLKLSSLDAMRETRQNLRQKGQKLVMTNGCFDLLHPGHIFFLQNARKLGDKLVVAVNSDVSVCLLKGPNRPVQNQIERTYTLAALDCVDHLMIFDDARLVNEIAVLQPDIYTKAGDYTPEKLDPGERAALEACGTEVLFLPFIEGFSTTGLIRKIIQAGGID